MNDTADMAGRQLTPYVYGAANVRVATIDGNPWFVAADVCSVLGLEDVRRAISRVDEDDRRQTPVVDSVGRSNPNTWVLNESGLYDLIIRSDKPEAKPFRRWITSEVLPSIRKHGSYSVPSPRSALDVAELMLTALRQQEARQAELEDGQRRIEARVDAIEGQHDWVSALGFAKLNGLPTSSQWLQRLGRDAGRIALQEGVSAVSVPHAYYGSVNSYPEWVWERAYEQRRASK